MPRTIAHRGFAGAAPENTLTAVRFAATHGADLVEVDVMPSADGEVVVFHDARLDTRNGSRGITDGTGVVWETPLATLRTVEVLDSGEAVPTLAEVCAALPGGVGLNVELKNPGAPLPTAADEFDPDALDERIEPWLPFVRDVLAVLDGFGDTVLFSSFAEGALAALRIEAPDASLAPLVDDQFDRCLDLAERYDATAIHPSLRAFTSTDGTLDPERLAQIGRAHEAGYEVNVWTVETWYEAERLRAAGADGLIADYPDLLAWRDW